MAGDPKQLPPTLVSDGALDAQMDRTLFDRLQDTGQPLAPLNSMPSIPATAYQACGKTPGGLRDCTLLGRLQNPDGRLQHLQGRAVLSW